MISVILPFRNAEKTLLAAAESILNQTYTELELIMVDNASTDNSPNVALQLSQQDKRVRLFHEPQQGVVFAHNKGLREAKFDFVARMDADDFALPTKLEKQLAYLQNHPDIGLVSTQVGGNEMEGGFREYIKWQNQQCSPNEINLARFTESPIANPTILFRKSICNEYGSYHQSDFPEDYELFLRWLSKGIHMAKLPEVLLHWNDSPTRLTRNDARYSEEAFYNVKTEYLIPWLKENNPYFPKVAIWGSGEKSRKRAALLRNKGIEIEFYIDIDCKNRTDCIHYSKIQQSGQYFIISYVSNWGAREKIREFLHSKLFTEGKNYILAS